MVSPLSSLSLLLPPPSAVAVSMRSWGRRPSRADPTPPPVRALPASRRVASVVESVSVMPAGGAGALTGPGGAKRRAKSRREPQVWGG